MAMSCAVPGEGGVRKDQTWTWYPGLQSIEILELGVSLMALLCCGSVADAKKEARYADVFVEVIPVQSGAAAANEVVLPLFCGRS